MEKNLLKLARNYFAWRTLVLHLNSKVEIMTFDETVDCIINQKKSVARFGDGELEILANEEYSIGFQKNTKQLRERLDKILVNSDNKVLIGLPHYFTRVDKTDSVRARLFWFCKVVTLSGSIKNVMGNERRLFADTQFTRTYMDTKRTVNVASRFEKLKQIWKDRNVLVVEGAGTKLGIGNDLLNGTKSVKRLIIPAENAFFKYDEIMTQTKEFVNSHDGWDGIVLICAGPTATVMAYELGIQGIQAIDLGHLDLEYEWFLRKCKDKQVIDGKYVNEARNGRNVKNVYGGSQLWKRMDLND